MHNPVDFLTHEHEVYSNRLSKLQTKLRWFGWYRFLAFIMVVLPFVIFGVEVLSAGLSVLFLALLLYLVKVNIKLERRKKKAATLKKIVEDELTASGHSFLHFPDGEEFQDVEHFYAYDLDLFGKGSLFQYLNRTATLGGKQILADWLIHPSKSKTEIELRQAGVREMALKAKWRLDYLAEGKLFEETKQMNDELLSWAEMSLKFKDAKTVRWLIVIVPLLTLAALIPAVLTSTYIGLVFMVFVQWMLAYMFREKIGFYYRFFGRKSQLLSKYRRLLHLIEYGEFQSEYLCELQMKVRKNSAGMAFKKLKTLVKEFEYRQNIIVGMALNSLLLWDVRCIYKLWAWHQKYHSELVPWLNAVAKTDALISLGNYAFNHPSYVYPEISDNGFEFHAKELGHPLLNPKKMVRNDLEIDAYSKILIVTGANMAGKSTFLRTVGVNLLLGETGAPVCATEMKFTPIDIYTNMRTTDSLLKDESYFFAELKRIKTVLDDLQKGKRYFVILDEMLKGTNSVDKLNGSKELIRRLVKLKAVAMIATHDLKLSEMQTEFPGQLVNKCFEIRIENNEMIFDYRLSDGVTQTMNATFLMKKMGII